MWLKKYLLQTNLLKTQYFHIYHHGLKQEKYSIFIWDHFWEFNCGIRENNIRVLTQHPWNCSGFSLATCERVSLQCTGLRNNFPSCHPVLVLRKTNWMCLRCWELKLRDMQCHYYYIKMSIKFKNWFHTPIHYNFSINYSFFVK